MTICDAHTLFQLTLSMSCVGDVLVIIAMANDYWTARGLLEGNSHFRLRIWTRARLQSYMLLTHMTADRSAMQLTYIIKLLSDSSRLTKGIVQVSYAVSCCSCVHLSVRPSVCLPVYVVIQPRLCWGHTQWINVLSTIIVLTRVWWKN